VRANGHTTAALTFVTREPGKEFDELYVRAADDLANRISVAMENANLVTTLRESDRRKDEFLAMLAHELRNPLAPIRNAAYLICEGAADNPLLARAAGVIERQVQHMTRLVDDLLDVARITSGKIILRQERIDIIPLVAHALETHRAQAAQQKLRITASLPQGEVFLTVDPTRFSQVLANLIDNAIKYTEAGGSVLVSVAPAADAVEIRVRDTGIGIEGDMLEKIFALFAQADRGRGRSLGGLGIGLMLVHTLVTMHGGTVRALSDGPGTGSEFLVRFPRD
jgi:two-component system CheB/CheR fusion protein